MCHVKFKALSVAQFWGQQSLIYIKLRLSGSDFHGC